MPGSTETSLIRSRKAISKIGIRLRDGELLPSDQEALIEYRSFVASLLPQCHSEIVRLLAGSEFLAACRVKRLESIVRKLRRERTMKLPNMTDIVGLRVIVNSPESQLEAVKRLCSELPVAKVSDYTCVPRMSGYRAVHLHLEYEGVLPFSSSSSQYGVELQIRTYYQHLWSSVSESLGEQVKEGGGTADERSYLASLSDRIAEFEGEFSSTVQTSFVPHDGPLQFFLIQFDHRGRELQLCDPVGSSIESAVRTFSYSESLPAGGSGKEVVLLGCASTQEKLRVTHIRYFSPRGIPELPASISREANEALEELVLAS